MLDAHAATSFRIYYQDAASDTAHSVLPALAASDAHRIDLAIICAGNFSETPDYPARLLSSLRPAFALVGHWESFFRSPEDELKVIPLLHAGALSARMRESLPSAWATLRPFSVARFHF